MRARVFPFHRWWPMVNRSTIKADLLAGLAGCILGLRRQWPLPRLKS
jgi:SulP family sulfate permease